MVAQLAMHLLCCNNQPLEQFDKTMHLFKLMENMRLLVEGTIARKLC